MSEGDATRPSTRAVARLANGLGAEVTDLRGRLQHALAEADRLEAAGRQDLAVAVLEDQREVLVEAHQRLQGHLAGAAVEREAEGVLLAALAELPPPGAVVPARAGAEGPAETPALATVETPQRMVVRLLAAAAAGVIGLVLLVVPEFDAGGLVAAGEPLDDVVTSGGVRTQPELIDLQVIPPALPPPSDLPDHREGDARRR